MGESDLFSNEENVRVLIDAWTLMVGRLPGSMIDHSGGVASMFGQVDLPFLNISAPDRPTTGAQDFRGIVTLIGKRAAQCPHPSLVALCEPWIPSDWEAILKEQAYTLALNMTGMAAEQLLPPRRPAPALKFRRVTDDSTARDIAMVNAHAYGMSPESFECICNTHLWHADTFGFVGYSEGRAVTTAAVFPVAGTRYVAFVATLPDANGKGYAEAVMRKAIQEAESAMGAVRLTLHASDAGRPLYSSMGFESGARVMLMMEGAGH